MALTQSNASAYSFPLNHVVAFSAASSGDNTNSATSLLEPTSPSLSQCVLPSPPPTDERDKPSSAFKPPGDMRREDDRLATFAAWPVSFVQPFDLAKAGFYYLGRDDEVRCAFCKVEIGRWEQGDVPAVDHERWAPHCPLLRRRPTGNVPRLTSSDAEAMLHAGSDVCGTRAAPAPVSGPAHPQFASEAARLRSFADWPPYMRQKPEDLADAGFFYMGQGDKTVCFHCGGGLKAWEGEDQPWEQHARWFKRCAYVQLVKGCEYVQRVASDMTAVTSARAGAVTPALSTRCEQPAPPSFTTSSIAPPASTTTPPAPPTHPSPPATLDDSKLCKICFAAEYDVCFVPCGHVVACAKCALSSDKCPLCRRTFQNAVRMYYS